MRGLRSTAILGLVLAGVVAYLYFVDAERPLGEVDVKEKAFAAEADAIETLTITNTAGETTRLTRQDGAWRIVEPVEAGADEAELASLTSSLSTLDIQRVLDDTGAEPAQFGLQPARVTVAFTVRDDPSTHQLLLGEQTPTGGDLYARRDDQPGIFLVSSYLEGTFNRATFDLRDKRVLAFDREQLTGLEIDAGTGPVRLELADNAWRLVSPIEARGDFSTVDGLVSSIAGARMERIVDEAGTDLDAAGLTRPGLVVTLIEGDGSRASLSFGRRDGTTQLARDSSRAPVFAVEAALADGLRKTVDDLRRREVFDTRPFEATRIALEGAEKTVTLERTTGDDGQPAWRDAAGAAVEATVVDDLLQKLTALRAEAFEAVPSAVPQVLTATLSARDGTTETVRVLRNATGAWAVRMDDPGAARLDAALLDDVLMAMDALQ
ncbi:MAG: DUF4340 domain-containing protein [Vicinamibacterales bacterium]